MIVILFLIYGVYVFGMHEQNITLVTSWLNNPGFHLYSLAEPVDELQNSYEQFLHRMKRHKNKRVQVCIDPYGIGKFLHYLTMGSHTAYTGRKNKQQTLES